MDDVIYQGVRVAEARARVAAGVTTKICAVNDEDCTDVVRADDNTTIYCPFHSRQIDNMLDAAIPSE